MVKVAQMMSLIVAMVLVFLVHGNVMTMLTVLTDQMKLIAEALESVMKV